ncbi:MAG: EscU/YscU/HrcU family type III secretion system export apparatus switch protein [Planctomycetota bacterium]
MSERTDQPSEEPTLRRWQKAFEDGQLAFSSEAIGAVIILTATLWALGYGEYFVETIRRSILVRLTYFDPMIESPETIVLAIRQTVFGMGAAIMPLLLTFSAMIIFVGVLQTRFNISTKPLELKWDKLSPWKGLKRLFSTRTLNRTALSILKATAIILSSYWVVMAYRNEITMSVLMDYRAVLMLGGSMMLRIGFLTAAFLVVLGLADVAFQFWKQYQDLMMTKQEIRDEQKDAEGDPQLRARIRRVQTEMSQSRAVQEVPSATVVITNPTHFAVALRYLPGESSAPIVIAKGADHLAKRIIAIAKENDVAVVERKPVARFLYANVEIGAEIPFEMYHAVAEIMNFIRALRPAG